MLNISIVLYRPDVQRVTKLLAELSRAKCLHTIWLLDNSPEPSTINSQLADFYQLSTIHYQLNSSNLGYGRAHNIAIRESIAEQIPFHLVMNDDIEVKAEDIDTLHAFMQAHPEVGQLMPRVVYPDGTQQYLAKMLPTPLDVFGRRFLPKCLMRKRNERYELRELIAQNKPLNVPYLSGCFMFLRTEAVLQARLFDERYFMYPEDIDLTRTIHRNWLTLYYPAVTIVHNHAKGSYHSLRLLWIHCVNMCRYFNKWGWFIDPERKYYNPFAPAQPA